MEYNFYSIYDDVFIIEPAPGVEAGETTMKNNQWKKDLKKKSQLLREKIQEMEQVSESMLLHEEYQNLDYRLRRLEAIFKR